MANTGQQAVAGIPQRYDIGFAVASATGTINPGDWLAYTGQFVVAQFSGGAPGTAYWKASGAGIALQSNPVLDPAGRSIQNSAMQIMVQGVTVVTAAFSGQPGLGVGAYPVSTGSGVAAATGLTGVGSTWQTAQPSFGSALSGTANGQQPAVATVIGSQNFANAGTGELIIRVVALAPDVRG